MCCELPAAVRGLAPAAGPRVWGRTACPPSRCWQRSRQASWRRWPLGQSRSPGQPDASVPEALGARQAGACQEVPAAGVATAFLCGHSWGVRSGPGRRSSGEARGTARDSGGLRTLWVWAGFLTLYPHRAWPRSGLGRDWETARAGQPGGWHPGWGPCPSFPASQASWNPGVCGYSEL